MGVRDKVENAAQVSGPECPLIFLCTFDKYRDLKFTKRVTEEEIKLYARDSLSWSDVMAYKSVTGQNITMHEADLIMGLDAIFEGRNDV